MSRNQVIPLRDASEPYEVDAASRLHFQWCRFIVDDRIEYGYRFMWSRDGRLMPFRGGARLPSWGLMQKLINAARAEGWADLDEKDIPAWSR